MYAPNEADAPYTSIPIAKGEVRGATRDEIGFHDKGATWTVPAERMKQLARQAARASRALA